MYISCRGIVKEDAFCQNVDVELDISRGLFSFLIVGLADKCIGESRERIMSAIKNSGFDSPKTRNHKITVSLVPAGIKKEGVLLDLPISIAYLSGAGKIDCKALENSIFIGELGLDGSIKQNDSLASVINSISKTEQADNLCDAQNNFEKVLPLNEHVVTLYSNFKDSQIELIKQLCLPNIRVFKFEFLKDLVDYLNETKNDIKKDSDTELDTETTKLDSSKDSVKREGATTEAVVRDIRQNILFDIDKIIGQEKAKRAILISICGNFNLIMSGPPGVGKTMLAKSAHQLLSTPKTSDYLEILSIHNKLERPFRSPHHTSSYASIVGGGTPIIAGEITKAHKGILFLDELPEFNKNIIESLRQPLEQKVIQINRANDTIVLPCDTLCICAMNLCPCGNKGIPNTNCTCTGSRISQYKQKVSQPFLERFHISINLPYEENKFNAFVRNISDDNLNAAESTRTTGRGMKYIIEKFKNIEDMKFEWADIELELLYKKSEERLFSMRAIKQIREITETICLIEIIQSVQKGLDTQVNTKNIIKKEHLLEAFSYKNDLLS